MDILHKGPTRAQQGRDLLRVGIQTLVKSNLTRNFNLDTKNQFTKTTKPINFTRSIVVIRITKTIKPINFTRSIVVIRIPKTIKSFSILENITQQLLENKHNFTLGQLFKITPHSKQYVVASLHLGKKNHYSRT